MFHKEICSKKNRISQGRVEELLVAEELWNAHTKPFFFPFLSAATCTNHPLEVDQSTLCQYKAVLDRNPRACHFSARFRRRPVNAMAR
ncbi:hypothetical protein Taro_014493 [Colocasia esculenta]|uniref:Uncharacterized protein n=1 Tax=Colocasia esculenta TaxID=4460 RepID=A0A843UIC9_COLES|nr:hypothetical protein [Colocasia esculenta]